MKLFDKTISFNYNKIENDLVKRLLGWRCSMSYNNNDWKLIFEDKFELNHLDETKWSYDTGGHGFGNKEWQYYTNREKNVFIENNQLVIKAFKEDYENMNYTSGKVFTKDKFSFTYGKVEVKALLPIGQGMWPAIWMMPVDRGIHGGWPSCGEIDIMEAIGHEPNKTYGTIHYGNPHSYFGGNTTIKNGTFADLYHVFGLEWEEHEIRWYLDGVLFHKENNWFSKHKDINDEYPAPFNKNFYLILNFAVGGMWPGYPDETTKFPQEFRIDYVKVFQK
ncbi:MAG: glycosyl hydrolase family protein [Haloplasmataceae bacterium]|jgi:beta-glucanase (GH16 family)|nr:glycosyl hydrolase family protein [Haloplasmataceae bacterium]